MYFKYKHQCVYTHQYEIETDKKTKIYCNKKKEQLRGNLRFNAATKKSTKRQTHKEKKKIYCKKKKKTKHKWATKDQKQSSDFRGAHLAKT